MRRSFVLALASLAVLLFTSTTQSKSFLLAANAAFIGSGTTWQERLLNRGDEVIDCTRTFPPSGTTFTNVTGPPGTSWGPTGFGVAGLNLAPNATATFNMTTTAPLSLTNIPQVRISKDCQKDESAQVTVESPPPVQPPPPPKVCECKKLRIVGKSYSSTGGSSGANKPPTVLKLTLHWFMTCSAGGPAVPLAGCAGRFEVLPPPGTDIKVALPKESVSCAGKCNPKVPVTSDGGALLKATSVDDLDFDNRAGKTMAFRFKLYCNRAGNDVPVGTEKISLVFGPGGFLDKKKSDLNGNGRPDGKEKK